MDRLDIGMRIVELARIAVAMHVESERDEAELSRQREATGGAGDRRLTEETMSRGGEPLNGSLSSFEAMRRGRP